MRGPSRSCLLPSLPCPRNPCPGSLPCSTAHKHTAWPRGRALRCSPPNLPSFCTPTPLVLAASHRTHGRATAGCARPSRHHHCLRLFLLSAWRTLAELEIAGAASASGHRRLCCVYARPCHHRPPLGEPCPTWARTGGYRGPGDNTARRRATPLAENRPAHCLPCSLLCSDSREGPRVRIETSPGFPMQIRDSYE